MKIYAGWYIACYAALCVCARPRDQYDENIGGLLYPKSGNNYDYEEQVSTKSKIFEDSKEFEEESSTIKARNTPILLPLIIEPEAEMLPVGYKGVKPPGVTHMELTRPQISSSAGKSTTLRTSATEDGNSGKSDEFNRDNDAYYAASKYETQVAKNDRDIDSLAVFEDGSKGDSKKENEKNDYTEVSNVSKSRFENEDRAKNHEEVVKKKGGSSYEIRDGRGRDHNTAGYRNVYHKNESKKDADFYSNRHQGGHFQKHGQYNEKHSAAEGKYIKDKTDDSRFVEMEANKEV